MWKGHSLQCSDSAAQSLATKFVAIRASIIGSHLHGVQDGPRAWASKNWTRLVAPAVSQCFQLQAAKLEDSGMRSAGQRLTKLANVPWDSLGLDAQPIVRKAGQGTGKASREDDDEDDDFPPRRQHRGDNGGGKHKGMTRCRRCKQHFKLQPQQTPREFFVEHNKICTARKPKK